MTLVVLSGCESSLTQPQGDSPQPEVAIPESGQTPLPGMSNFEIDKKHERNNTSTKYRPSKGTAKILQKFISQHPNFSHAVLTGYWNDEKNRYIYNIVGLNFPSIARNKDHVNKFFDYQEYNKTGTTINRKLSALIPDTEAAKKLIDRWLGIDEAVLTSRSNSSVKQENNTTKSCTHIEFLQMTYEFPNGSTQSNTVPYYTSCSNTGSASPAGSFMPDSPSGGPEDIDQGFPDNQPCLNSQGNQTLSCLPDGGGGGAAPVVDNDEEDREEIKKKLKDLLETNKFALLQGPCEEIDKYTALAKFTPADAAVIGKLKDVEKFSSAIVGAFNIQNIENAAGDVVNMDEFSVQVNDLPNGMNKNEFLHHIRTNINDFINTDYSEFTPYDQTVNYPFNDTQKWNSHNPLGAIIHIDIAPDDGSVIISDHTPSSWTFSTISAPLDWTHPVSGNREFGYTENSDGSYTFYTKGVDRFTKNWFSENISTIINLGDTFSDADNLWKSFQRKIKEFVNAHGGNANLNDPKMIRPDWKRLQNVLNGSAGVNSLGCN